MKEGRHYSDPGTGHNERGQYWKNQLRVQRRMPDVHMRFVPQEQAIQMRRQMRRVTESGR